MKRVFTEVGSLDRKCYEEFFLSEDILMEHAANALAEEIKMKIPENSEILFLCGGGNNGADGIACARILQGDYKTFVMLPYGVRSHMAKLQLKRYEVLGGDIVDEVVDADCYVDALFGSGLKRVLDDKSSKIIRAINGKDGYKLSCDIPSGLGDNFFSDEVFRADKTVTMGALKRSLFSDFAKDFVGEVEVADLGVASKNYESESHIFLLEREDLRLPFRDKENSNKGSFGHTGIVVGEKEGAAILSAEAAFHFGSGLVSVISEKKEIFPPYIMSSKNIPSKLTSLVIGMGLGEHFDADEVFDIEVPFVIDADMFYKPVIKDLLEKGKSMVLTPHPKEFASLLDICSIADVDTKEIQRDRFGYLEKFADKYPEATLLLKGANVLIYGEGKIFINPYGNVMLAKGGSGDVLSGMIGSLLAQGETPLNAAVNASLAHSLSIERMEFNNYALNPMDICEGIKWL